MLVLAGFAGLMTNQPATTLETALTRIDKAREYTVRVSIPGGEKVLRFRRHGHAAEGTTWEGWRVQPYLLR